MDDGDRVLNVEMRFLLTFCSPRDLVLIRNQQNDKISGIILIILMVKRLGFSLVSDPSLLLLYDTVNCRFCLYKNFQSMYRREKNRCNMDWQILTTFFSFVSLLIGILVLAAQTHIKRAQNSQAQSLADVQSTNSKLLSIVSEMDRQQDLFVRQMPPHQEQVNPMDTQDLPECYKWLTSNSEQSLKEHYNCVVERPSLELQHITPPVKKTAKGRGIKRGPYKKKPKL